MMAVFLHPKQNALSSAQEMRHKNVVLVIVSMSTPSKQPAPSLPSSQKLIPPEDVNLSLKEHVLLLQRHSTITK
jgi:hypothetical protein